MKPILNFQGAKRPETVTLSEELVAQAKQNSDRQENWQKAEAAAQAWNAFDERGDLFADEHSTL